VHPIIQFEFELTSDDYQHSLAVHASGVARESAKQVSVQHVLIAVCCMVLILPGFLVDPPRTGNGILPSFADILSRLGPLLLPSMLVGVSFRLLREAGRAQGWIWVVLSCMVFAMLLGWPPMQTLLDSGKRVDFIALYRAAYPAICLISVFVLTAWSIISTQRRAVMLMWLGSEHLHGPKTLTADENQLVLSDPIRQFVLQWPSIVRVMDAGDMVLLYVGKLVYWPITTRGLSASDRDTFRQMVRNKVENRVSAFPVLPIRPGKETAHDGTT
jgi:hypothetical protein